MIGLSTVFLASLLAVASASPTPRSNMVVRADKKAPPPGFAFERVAESDKTIPLRIALVSKDFVGLEKAIYDVSTPGSANYGKHLSKEQVEAYVKPAQESLDAVNQFLQSNGIKASKLSPAGEWLGFDLPISKANELFDADFSVYKHVDSGEESIRTLSYSVPSSLQNHIDVVHPTNNFVHGDGRLPLIVSPLKNNGTLSAADACGGYITPACLQQLYGLPTAKATQSSNKLAVTGFIEQYAQQADLKSFLSALRPDLDSSTSFTLETIDGGSNPQGSNYAGIEANLDIQYTVGVAQGVPISFISAGSDNHDGWAGFLDMVNYILSLDAPPQVVTTSYGFNEADIDSASANTLCNGYAQLAARGVSVLFASGDGGVGGVQSTSCTTFIPTFPSTCPYVTSVGGTTGATETGAGLSGGGFSAIFPAPDYQSSVVSSYVSGIGSQYSGLFTPTGRGIPDVAAQATNVEIFNAGQGVIVAGTSCASPIFASTISLLNDELVAAGKSPLGFLNPFIYANPGAFHDITSGNNPGCGTNGFSAKSGWDPVTGFGSPNFAALRSAVGL